MLDLGLGPTLYPIPHDVHFHTMCILQTRKCTTCQEKKPTLYPISTRCAFPHDVHAENAHRVEMHIVWKKNRTLYPISTRCAFFLVAEKICRFNLHTSCKMKLVCVSFEVENPNTMCKLFWLHIVWKKSGIEWLFPRLFPHDVHEMHIVWKKSGIEFSLITKKSMFFS